MSVGRKLCSFLLVVALLLGTGEFPTLAQAKEQAQQVQSSKVKQALAKLGTGEAAQINVTLTDKSIRSGYVSEVDENSFVVTNPAYQTRVRIGYSEAKRLKAENSATHVKLSLPAERPKVLRAAIRVATLGIAGRRRVYTSSNNFLSKPAIVVLAVLAVGLILIGIELKKS
jgi:hypothetical protein